MTESEYEQLLESNERTLWEITDRYGRLSKLVRDEIWKRAAMTMTPDGRADMAERLAECGVEVEA